MKHFNWKRLLPHVVAIGIFFIVACIYCLPAINGMIVNMHDGLGWRGMAHQSFEFKEKYGHFPLWTNSVFGGMPVYQIAFEGANKITLGSFHYFLTLGLPEPASIFFLACLCFYILCVVLNVKPWIGTMASLGFSYASYSAVIVAVGHTTKFISMAYAPAVIAGLILLTQRKYILGFMLTMLFSTLQIYQNHLQVVYYTAIISVCIGIGFVIKCIKEKDFKHLGISALLASVAGAMTIGAFAIMLLPLNEYAKETMRGGRSELTSATTGKENKTKGGLDKDYAFNWSYGIDETLTAILPAYKGGSSGPSELGEGSKAVEAMQNAGMPGDAVNYFYNYLSSYWGSQPNTSGTVYFGAIFCLLFLAGLFVVKDANKGWIIATTIIGIVLAWGNNFSAVNYFLFDHLPMYNKFRAPTIALVIPQLTIPLLAALALQTLFYSNYDLAAMKKKLQYAGIAIAAVSAVLLFGYIGGSFKGKNDNQIKEGMTGALSQIMGQQPNGKEQAITTANAIMSGLSADRKALYGSDLFRVIFLIVLGGGILWLTINKKLKPELALAVLAVAGFIDLITVDLRYLKKENFIDKEEYTAVLQPTKADLQIKQDPGFFRVFDQTSDPWNNSESANRCSYNHNAIGGYHPAKLALYQDIIENQLSKGNMQVFNMLNTKYFITNDPSAKQPIAQQNPDAYGNVWLVKNIKYVNDANEEMKALDSINKNVAIVAKREIPKISVQPQFDSTASIKFIENKNDYAKYEFNAGSNQFAVFSEIYYPYGWIALIDGKEAPIVRTNYLLRGLSIPGGKHIIEMKFEPATVKKGDNISMILGILGYTILIGGSVLLYRNRNKFSPTV